MVPNIIDSMPSLNLIEDGQKLRMLFSPTHPRPSRWGGKTSEAFEKKISSLAATGLIDFVMPKEAISPEQLLQIRRNTHLTIDEVITGGYHQVSLEGLCAGNVVINNADYFSKSALASTVGSSVMPPFLNANEDNIIDVLMDLVRNPVKVRELQTSSYEYFKNYLMPDKIIEIYMRVYKEVLNG